VNRAALLIAFLIELRILVLSAAESPPPAVETFQYTNRLAAEKSPYLLQHAHNPVNWYPWGEEAFARARREDKPIFLSVGYSTCHWCHVMERESFENPEIARILNEHFVCIKVDREERPDVDRVYMMFVQATTGGGGWPMNVWLTPDLKPFFGGTYFPPEQRYDLPAFPALLKRIASSWQSDRAKLVQQGESFMNTAQPGKAPKESEPGALTPALLASAFKEIASGYDDREGGFGRSPKFPRPVTLNFLFQIYAREGTNSKVGHHALEMSLFTLRKMAAGGIHDQIGGGFHRYSVDRFWRVPHFEKMLYDQAQLARSYLDAFQITHDPFFEEVARDILEYVRRNLMDSSGGFYSAEDADSPSGRGQKENSEGAFYVWTAEEIKAALGKSTAAVIDFLYGIEAKGSVPAQTGANIESEGRNILFRKETVESAAAHFKLTSAEIERSLGDARRQLFQVRSTRPRPRLDDKIITAWNGLMISAFARAYQILGDAAYLQAATRSAVFLRDKLYDATSGELIRSFRERPSVARGFVDDYAFLIQGLLDLYEASFDIRWLRWAIELQEKQDTLFWDGQNGGYFSMREGDANILVRVKEDYDGAEPSPNSVSALNLLRLWQMTDNTGCRERATRTLMHFADRLGSDPANLPQMLVAIDWHLTPPRQIVLAGQVDAPETRSMLQTIHRKFLPKKILLLADGDGGQEFLGSRLEFIKGVSMLHDKTTAYVCDNAVCQLPTDDPEKLQSLLEQRR